MYTQRKSRERDTISAPCLGHDEIKRHLLVTYPGTLGSNLSRTTGTSFLERNRTAGALPLGSLWQWMIKGEFGGIQGFTMPENKAAHTPYCWQTTARFSFYEYSQLLTVKYPRAASVADSPGREVSNMSLLVPRAIWEHKREAGFNAIKAKNHSSSWLLVSTNHL